MSNDLTPQQRLALITLVGSLPEAVFKRLIFAFNAPRALIASNAAAQGDRAADLLDWVEGPLGCRLKAFLPLLEEVAPKAFQEALGGRSNLESETAEPFPQPNNLPQSRQASIYYDFRGAQFAGGCAENGYGNQVNGSHTNHKQSFQQQFPGASLNENLSQNPFRYTGTLSQGSKSYISRRCDQDLLKALEGKRKLIAVQGEHQIGKSSLLMQVEKMEFCEHHRYRFCYIDLQGKRTENITIFMNSFFDDLSASLDEEIEDWNSLSRVLRTKFMVICIDEFGALSSELLEILISKLYFLATQSDANVRVIVCIPKNIEHFIKQKLKEPNPRVSARKMSL